MGTRQDYDDAIRLGAENCRPRAAPRCGLSFTTRAFTATRRARVRAPLPSWRHALRSLRLSAVAAPRPRALNLPPPFPVPGSRFGLPPARRIALWTSPTKLVMESSRVSAPLLDPSPRASPMLLQSTITCPHCALAKTETMPTDACQFFYECRGCGTKLKPKPGDCCVFCSYGSVACPPMQAERSGESGAASCCAGETGERRY
jgi:hypothetical protein